MSLKRMLLISITIVILLSGLFLYNKWVINRYEPSAYETELIKYFLDVALQSEHGDYINKIVKWRKPMLLYVIKDKPYSNQVSKIKKTINDINLLATDGFRIELTENLKNSNAFLYLCSKSKLIELAPNFSEKVLYSTDKDISGYADMEFYWDNYNIYKANIYIDSKDPIDIQKSVILEEITQSIGLPYDPETYPDSIFYEHKSEEEINTSKYSALDKDIIKLLYHPRMKPGLNKNEVIFEIKRILKNKEIELSGN